MDSRTEDFADVLGGYGAVLDSLGGENLEKSLTVLKPGGQAIGVSGPPDPGFAQQPGAPKPLSVVMALLSRRVRKPFATHEWPRGLRPAIMIGLHSGSAGVGG